MKKFTKLLALALAFCALCLVGCTEQVKLRTVWDDAIKLIVAGKAQEASAYFATGDGSENNITIGMQMTAAETLIEGGMGIIADQATTIAAAYPDSFSLKSKQLKCIIHTFAYDKNAPYTAKTVFVKFLFVYDIVYTVTLPDQTQTDFDAIFPMYLASLETEEIVFDAQSDTKMLFNTGVILFSEDSEGNTKILGIRSQG